MAFTGEQHIHVVCSAAARYKQPETCVRQKKHFHAQIQFDACALMREVERRRSHPRG